VRGAAVAEIVFFIRISIRAGQKDASDISLLQAPKDKPRQIELPDPLAGAGVKKTAITGFPVREYFHEISGYFIGGDTDCGTNNGIYRVAGSAQRVHFAKDVFKHAAQRAFPSRVRRADDRPACAVRSPEQHRRAVGGQDAEDEFRLVRRQRVGLNPVRGRLRHDNAFGTMRLVHGDQPIRRQAKFFRHAAAVFDHGGTVVLRAHAAIEAVIDTGADAAPAAEKAVRGVFRFKYFIGDEHIRLLPYSVILSVAKNLSYSRRSFAFGSG
jgi:hypothetical protein